MMAKHQIEGMKKRGKYFGPNYGDKNGTEKV